MELLGTRKAKREFEAFVSSCAGPLFRSGYLMTADTSETEDLLQETLFKVARRWHRVRSMEQPLAYARRILINLVLDGAKARARRHEELELADDLEVVDQGAVRVLSGIDNQAEFIWALAALSRRQRAVLILRYWDGLSEAEVADLLACPIGTVKSSAARGMTELRRMLGKRSDIPSQRAPGEEQEKRSC